MIRLLRVSTELDSGAMADGWVLYIELFGCTFEIAVCRRR